MCALSYGVCALSYGVCALSYGVCALALLLGLLVDVFADLKEEAAQLLA